MKGKNQLLLAVKQNLLILAEFEKNDVFREIYMLTLKKIKKLEI